MKLASMLKYVAVVIATYSFGFVATAAPKIEAVPGEYLVKLANKNILSTNNVFKMFGAEKIRTVSKAENIYVVKRNVLERSEFALSSLQNIAGVEIVEPNYIYRVNRTPNDPMLGELWGLKNSAQKGGRAGIDISAELAWDIQTGSKDVLVAVIDTGLDYTHPDLKNNSWTNEAEANGQAGVDDDKNGYVDDIHGYDFVNNDGDPMDDHGHGTHCSGTIGAQGDDGSGVVGVNWNVKIMGVKFLSAEGSGTLEDAIKAIDYATTMGAQIQSNSWGGGGYTELLKQAIERARDKNILFVAAAGNESNDNDANPSYPATYEVDNILSVAALDNAGQLAYFSSYGKTTVHVAAPGVDVTSTVPFKINSTGYDTWSGTSMATPHVSGVAALLLAQDASLKVADIKGRIMNGTKSLGSLRGKVATAGLLNAFYALTGQAAPPDMEDPFNWTAQEYKLSSEHPYPNNSKAEYVVKVDGASQVAIFFERFETERGYDVVEFKDANGVVVAKWSGNHNGEFSPPVPGDTIIISFKADDSVNGYGFDISKAAYR